MRGGDTVMLWYAHPPCQNDPVKKMIWPVLGSGSRSGLGVGSGSASVDDELLDVAARAHRPEDPGPRGDEHGVPPCVAVKLLMNQASPSNPLVTIKVVVPESSKSLHDKTEALRHLLQVVPHGHDASWAADAVQ